MKMDIIFKSMLYESLGQNIAESPLIGAKLKIDERFTGNHGNNVSKKSNGGYQCREVFSSSCCEVFFYDSRQKC